jgi:curli biogenesis system outer membrane secretion channel CsgG
MRKYLLVAAMAASLVLAACGAKDDKPAAAQAPAGQQSAAPAVPDVGKVESVKVQASGLGATPGEAMAEALKMALLQVNGATIQTASVSTKYGLDVSLGKDSASLRASEFVEQVKQKSGGVIQSLQVVSLEEPTEKANRFKYTISADIAKFKASADMQKIKLVIAPLRFDQAQLPMGDKMVPSAEVAATLQQRISDALVQTGRFAVLDRDFSPEIAQELNMISSGQAPSAELSKLSQAASADIVWSAHVSGFAYNRHARALKTSDRELVSYSGGWSISQKLVNVATRQVMTSDSLRGQAPSTEPTTLGTGVDSGRVMADMSDELVKAVVGSILQRTFPLMVVARDGTNVVLSQGGQAVREGARYAVVSMGNEMKDPQTGQSLGRMESPCCELVIDRVTPNLSYGHLENVRSNLDSLPPGGLQVRAELKGTPAATVAATAPAAAPAEASRTIAAPAPVAQAAPVQAVKPVARKAPVQEAGEPAKKNDDKW